jgi:hypothetical protein
MDMVQRQPLSVPPEHRVISRQDGEPTAAVETTASSETTEPAAEPNLDRLARQVYPLIKRMLAVELERRPR